MDPLARSPWSTPATVAGFAESPPNAALIAFAQQGNEREQKGESTDGGCDRPLRVLDIGCGAGRNAVPLARLGWDVYGIDLSWPMLAAAAKRARDERLTTRVHLALAPMDLIPAADDSFDLVIAHGIWNLARSTAEFRQAAREAARVAKPAASLFVFTFSRNTLPRGADPVPGEPFVFTQFSGEPQVFLTEEQLRSELALAGFVPDPRLPLRELNRPGARALRTQGTPVIYEGAFRRR